MDQTLAGTAGIVTGETFGTIEGAIQQRHLTGTAGIPSGQAFGAHEGVRIPVHTVPVGLNYAY